MKIADHNNPEREGESPLYQIILFYFIFWKSINNWKSPLSNEVNVRGKCYMVHVVWQMCRTI